MKKKLLKDYNAVVKEATALAKRLGQWNVGKLALTGPEYTTLLTTHMKLKQSLPTLCPHDKTVVMRGTYTDVGYGCDRHYTHYDIKCLRCDAVLLNKTDDGNRRQITNPSSLEETISEYKKHESLTDDNLRELGIRRSVSSTETFVRI